MLKKKRTTEEYIILALSACTVIAIIPFVAMRLMAKDWLIGALDLCIVSVSVSIFVYVLRTGRTVTAGRILACSFITTVFLTVLAKGVAQTVWIYPSLSAMFFVLNAYLAAIICLFMLVAIGVVIWPQLEPLQALQIYTSVLATLFFTYTFSNRMRIQQVQLERIATRDPLTDAGNRRSMEQKLLEIGSYQRRNQDCRASLILMDIDNFKVLNDTYGHTLGDEMLVELVQALDKRVRSSDSLFRFGGEEFVVIAEQTGIEDASKLAEQLRAAIENSKKLSKYNVTVSVGTAQFKGNETPFEWLGRADKAMYQAKHFGGNNCRIAA